MHNQDPARLQWMRDTCRRNGGDLHVIAAKPYTQVTMFPRPPRHARMDDYWIRASYNKHWNTCRHLTRLSTPIRNQP